VRKKTRTAETLGPAKERFASADLSITPRDFVSRELAKPRAARFEAVCFDARRTSLAAVLDWIRGLDAVEEDYYVRRVVVLKPSRTFKRDVPEDLRERPDITWLATADPADGPTLYRRHVTEMFEATLGLFGIPRKRRKSRG
jgi:hypothetical protein